MAIVTPVFSIFFKNNNNNIVGSKNKSIGVYFLEAAMLTIPQCPLRSRRIAEAREQLNHRI